jgi:hypothetical protein
MVFKKDIWFAYVINNVIENCRMLSMEHCKGCQLKLKSSILHEHEHLSLKEKIETHLQSVRKNLDVELQALFREFKQDEVISTYEKLEILTATQTLIQYATPQSLYYGCWMNIENEFIIRKKCIRINRKRKNDNKAQSIKSKMYHHKKQKSSQSSKKKHPNAIKPTDVSNKKYSGNTIVEETTPINASQQIPSIEEILWEELNQLSSDEND